jgi:glycerol-3-phosphate acyltransferase PlsY
MLTFPVLLALAYLSGAVPWSVWLGRRLFRVDPRRQSDGNPGAANAFRAGGWRLGVAVLMLDFLKGFVPVFIAQWGLRLPESQLFWVALMPTLGHAFSIFLGFRGGRALDTLFGVWTGLTLYEAPLVMGGTALASMLALKNDAARSLAIPVVLIAYLLLAGKPLWMVALAAAQLVILAGKLAAHSRGAGWNANPAERRGSALNS